MFRLISKLVSKKAYKTALMVMGLVIATMLVVFPVEASAKSSGTTFDDVDQYQIFSPIPGDKSVEYLGSIFGNVGTVLAGNGQELIAMLFGIFNTCVLALAIVIAAYTTLVGTLNSAGEGEMLGKKMNSIWVPLRATLGIGLLIPSKASGYCVIQIFMMWVVINGIGAADTLWSSAVNYLHQGGLVSSASDSMSKTQLDTTTNNVFNGLVCMQAVNTGAGNYNNTLPVPTPKVDGTKVTYVFRAKNSNDEFVNCGSFTFDIGDSDFNTSTLEKAKNAGLEQLLPTLNSIASYYVNYNHNYPDSETDRDQATYNLVGPNFLTTINDVYNSYIVEAASIVYTHNNKDTRVDHMANADADGWIVAGSFYYGMAQTNNEVSEKTIEQGTLTWDDDKNASSYAVSGTPADVSDKNASKYVDYSNTFYDSLRNTANEDSQSYHINKKKGHKLAKYITTMFNPLTLIISNVTHDFREAIGNTKNNPIVSAQKFGHKVLYMVSALWLGLFGTAVALSIPLGISPSTLQPGYLVWKTVLAFLMPLIYLLLGSLAIMGGTLGVLIPLMPYVIFTIAALGWMVAVIETMVAAPLVAIGLMHPDGHDVWGKAEPTMMLITNIFLRPSLMIIGMCAGLMVSYAAAKLLNLGFSNAVSMMNNGEVFLPSMIESILVLALYIGLFVAMMNKSFSLIYQVPDKVLRWLSGGEMAQFGAGTQEDLQKMQGSYEAGSQGMRELGSAQQQGFNAGIQAMEQPGFEGRQRESESASNLANQQLGGQLGAGGSEDRTENRDNGEGGDGLRTDVHPGMVGPTAPPGNI